MDFEVYKRHDGFDTVRFEDGTFGYRTARGGVRGGFKSPSGATLSAKSAIAKAGAEALSSPDPATAKADEELAAWSGRIREVYGRAESEMRAKQAKAMEAYESKRADWEARVSSGDATREEFDAWLRGQSTLQGRMIGLTEDLARTAADADAEAVRMVSEGGHLAGAYAEGMNFATYQVESGAGASTSFALYDRATVEGLLREGRSLIPRPATDVPKDAAWNLRKMHGEILQGVLQGESVDDVARRLRKVLDMDRRAALRTARTALTSAQNAGRVDAYARAKAMGIGLRQEWQATYDARTRHSHAAIDGEVAEVGEAFSNGLRFPGDPAGPASEVYNCRCTLVPVLGGLDDGGAWRRDLKVGDESYEQWKARHADAAGAVPAEGAAPPRRMVEGRDILDTWSWDRESSGFDFAIEDAMHAQGFDGLPRVVSAEEFDRLYTGEQPLLLRTFSAPDAETLAAYDDMLLNGKWYVDCSDGGSQYGQGMYAAGVYGEKGAKRTQKLFDGAMREMEHYQTINGRSGMESTVKTMTLDPSAKVVTYKELTGTADFRQAFKRFDAEQSYAANRSAYRSLVRAIGSADYLSESERKSMTAQLDKAMASLERSHAKGTRVATDKFLGVAEDMRYRQLGYDGDLSSYGDKRDWGHSKFGDNWGLQDALKSDSLDANEAMSAYEHVIDKNAYAGVYGTVRGYDAINAVGHGASRSYTVVLNRTKLIIREE